MSLGAVTPPALRVFADHPETVSGLNLESISLPIEWEAKRTYESKVVAVGELDEALIGLPGPRDKSWRLRCDPAFIKDLTVRVVRATQKPKTAPVRRMTFDLDAILTPVPQGHAHARVLTFEPVPGEASVLGGVEPGASSKVESFNVGANYEVLCLLAQGGMAEVFLARYHSAVGFRRLVLLKRLLPELTTDSRVMRMLLDEARLAARLDHPNIVSVLDLGKSEGAYFIAMEYVHGKDLSAMATRLHQATQRFPVSLALGIMADVCSALARAHQADSQGRCLVHGDVTPRNILVSFDGITKLVDFGLVRLSGPRVRDTDEVVGTPAYVAPECFNGAQPTPRSDIWAVGVTLYLLLTGFRPFRAATPEKLTAAILGAEPAPPTDFCPDLPAACDSILQRVLEKNPEQRYQSASELEEELRHLARQVDSGTDRRTLAEFLRSLYPEQIAAERKFTSKLNKASLTEALLFAPAEDVSQLFSTIDPTGEPAADVATSPIDSSGRGF